MLTALQPWLHEIVAAIVVAFAGWIWSRFGRAIKSEIRDLIRAELGPLSVKVLKLEGRVERLEGKRSKSFPPTGG